MEEINTVALEGKHTLEPVTCGTRRRSWDSSERSTVGSLVIMER